MRSHGERRYRNPVVRPVRSRRWRKVALVVGSVLLGTPATAGSDIGVYRPALGGPDRLLTNEYAHANPDDGTAVRSSDWDVTSGSLFASDGAGWTGTPDAASPGPH